MARPKKSDTAPSASERIKEEFWNLYKTRPLDKVHVTDICQRVPCNKTTFYYHFEDVAGVLREIESDCLLVDMPDLAIDILSGRKNRSDVVAFVANNQQRIDKVRILLGAQGDPLFKNAMEHAVTKRWCNAFGIDEAQLDEIDRLFMRYSMGGIMGIMANDHPDKAEPFDVDPLFELGFDYIMPHMKKMAGKYLDRQDPVKTGGNR